LLNNCGFTAISTHYIFVCDNYQRI